MLVALLLSIALPLPSTAAQSAPPVANAGGGGLEDNPTGVEVNPYLEDAIETDTPKLGSVPVYRIDVRDGVYKDTTSRDDEGSRLLAAMSALALTYPFHGSGIPVAITYADNGKEAGVTESRFSSINMKLQPGTLIIPDQATIKPKPRTIFRAVDTEGGRGYCREVYYIESIMSGYWATAIDSTGGMSTYFVPMGYLVPPRCA